MPGVSFEEWCAGAASLSLVASVEPVAVAAPLSADPFADDLPAVLVAQAAELAAASGQTFSAALALIERINAAVASW